MEARKPPKRREVLIKKIYFKNLKIFSRFFTMIDANDHGETKRAPKQPRRNNPSRQSSATRQDGADPSIRLFQRTYKEPYVCMGQIRVSSFGFAYIKKDESLRAPYVFFGDPKGLKKRHQKCCFQLSDFEVEERRWESGVWVSNYQYYCPCRLSVSYGPQRLLDRGLYAVLDQSSLYGPRNDLLQPLKKCSKKQKTKALCHCRIWRAMSL